MGDYLILKLQGPMQSWGEHTFEGTRPSGNFPTLSALLGLLGACLGIRRNEYDRLQQLASSVNFAIRKDVRQVKSDWGDVKLLSATKITDYHTIQNARKNYRGFKDHKTIQTWREYLLDAEYTVAVWVKDEAMISLTELETAVKKPVFTPCLGRRSCPLAQPLFYDRFSERNALDALKKISPYSGIVHSDQNIDNQSERNLRLRDMPLVGQPRQFATRTVYVYGDNHVSK